MPKMPEFKKKFEDILDIFAGGRRFPFRAILIKPYVGAEMKRNENKQIQDVNNPRPKELNEIKSTFYSVRNVNYRIEQGESGMDLYVFSNGFFCPKPPGTPSFTMINGQPGVILGTDDNDVWNVNINSQGLLDLISSSNQDKYITYQNLKYLKDKFQDPNDIKKYFNYAMMIMAIVGVLMTIIFWTAFDGMNKNSAAIIASSGGLERASLANAYAIMYAYNVDIPQLNLYRNQTNLSSMNQPPPQQPGGPSMPSLPKI